MEEKTLTSSSGTNGVHLRVPGVQDKPGSVGRMSGVKVREGHVDAAQP